MAKLTLSDVGDILLPSSQETINTNNDRIETALENTLSRDGTSPNQMEANLDMNSNRILNLPFPDNENEPLRKRDISAVLPDAVLVSDFGEDFVAAATPAAGRDLLDLYDADVGSNISVTSTGGTTARTLAARGRDLGVNVLDFGADRTGVADSRAAIVAAIAAADSAKVNTVWFPPGRYKINTDGGTITVPEGISLTGTDSGHLIRNDGHARYPQGTVIEIYGTTNIVFTCERGVYISNFNFHWPDQVDLTLATPTPTAYPHLIRATLGHVKVENVKLNNCDKFIWSGDLAGATAGSPLILENIYGMFTREFARIENSQSENKFNNIFISSAWSPHIDAVDRSEEEWNLDNTKVFILVGECDGLNVVNMQVNRVNTLIEQTDPTATEAYGINFGLFSNCMFDGVQKIYTSDGRLCPRNLQFSNCFFGGQHFTDTTATHDLMDFNSSVDPGGDTWLTFNGCSFHAIQKSAIRVRGANAIDHVTIVGCTFTDWGNGTSPAGTPCIEIDCANTTLTVEGTFFNAAGGGLTMHGIVVGNASKVLIGPTVVFKGLDVALKVTGTVPKVRLLADVETVTTPFQVTGTVTNYEGNFSRAFTPAITFATPGDLAITYSTQTGEYVRIGNLVIAEFQITTSAFTHTTASGTLSITGLPFTVGSMQMQTPLRWVGITKAGYTDLVVQPAVATTTATLRASGSGVAAGTVVAADMPTGGTVDLRGMIVYTAA